MSRTDHGKPAASQMGARIWMSWRLWVDVRRRRRGQYRHRYTIEQKNAELKRWHGLARARYWGRLKVHGQVLLAAIVVNAKRVVKLLRARGRPALLAPGLG